MAITRKGFAQPQYNPIRATPEQYSNFQKQVAGYTAANRQFEKTHGGTFSSPGNLVDLGIKRQSPNLDSAASAGIGILGAASLAASSLVPVAAAAGIGYGVYKLGESFKLW